ncbi:hypothetical protein SCLCIDRAFT_297212 [Scleroderma citrinum Foug A]|uniref:Uncharacterized protein n=1 Tax=Scleroderma citrinum Foug A TaxID=1036808 RepID=A0A0C3DGA4_9AGAM|nr:hypothetical protein SCLCIDRAFT_297212 [Scleroderma citrinum Foug A]
MSFLQLLANNSIGTVFGVWMAFRNDTGESLQFSQSVGARADFPTWSRALRYPSR